MLLGAKLYRRLAKTTVTESVSMGRSRPKEKHQHDSPNDTPYSPSDVGVFRLPFQDSFVKGHDKYPSLFSSHDTESHEALIASTIKDSHRCSTTKRSRSGEQSPAVFWITKINARAASPEICPCWAHQSCSDQ